MRVIYVSCTANEAASLARRLVDERLVACASILPGIRSIYRWEGTICDEEETVLLMETSAERLDAAMSRIADLHSYEVPKIIALEPQATSAPYLQWVRGETRHQ